VYLIPLGWEPGVRGGGESGFRLIGHGHPKFQHVLQKHYEDAGIEFVADFEEVMERADVYVNDCSSTMYEFCVTGKPVVILNAPWFRKFVNYGIRFWLWTDIGPQVDKAEDVLRAIEGQLGNPEQFRAAREKMVSELYPFLGVSAQRAANSLVEFCESSK
jgi:CDP-glycerol glycerophosphotransferase (TagB/SpsB family)